MNIVSIVVLLFSTTAFAYPKECTDIENRFKELIRQTDSGKNTSNEIGIITSQMNNPMDKYPECEKNILPLAQNLIKSLDKLIQKEKNQKIQKPTKNASQNVSYSDWFTLVNSEIKNGKKYSFEACVIGNRNATAVACNIPGSAAKRVFYNTDDIKDNATKQRWINTINEKKCVTAYVTGGEAFITDIQDSCN